jgi:hypothetical protein
VRVNALLQQAEEAARTHFAAAQAAAAEKDRSEKKLADATARKLQLQEQVVDLEGQLAAAKDATERVQGDRDRVWALYRDSEDRATLLEEQAVLLEEQVARDHLGLSNPYLGPYLIPI